MHTTALFIMLLEALLSIIMSFLFLPLSFESVLLLFVVVGLLMASRFFTLSSLTSSTPRPTSLTMVNDVRSPDMSCALPSTRAVFLRSVTFAGISKRGVVTPDVFPFKSRWQFGSTLFYKPINAISLQPLRSCGYLPKMFRMCDAMAVKFVTGLSK